MKLPHDAIVLVADGEKALLFRNEGDEKFPVLETLHHEEIRNGPAREQGLDQPGRSFASRGKRRSSYSQTDRHIFTEQRFALEAALQLERVAGGSECELVVVAPPKFLGDLRRHIGSSLARRISAEIPKDLAHHATDDVVEAITSHSGHGKGTLKPRWEG